MDKLRMRFRKIGRAVYISHLDLMQTMQRAFFRAEIPLRYSEGYTPHPLISIALPLSVGTASECELMDFRLREETDISSMPGRLTSALPEGIEVLDVYEPTQKAAAIKWLRVHGVFEYDERTAAGLICGLESFFSADSIVIRRRTKRGEGEANIRPSIRDISFSVSGSDIALDAVISAQEPTLKPELLTDSLRQLAPELCPDFARFTRIETYDSSMKVFR